MRREEQVARLRDRDEPFDIAIVGGGATGLGAALDAASRGHSVVLIEQHDFAKGTSSRSTKLVHGGVRYLKQGDVKLVLEALRERGRLLRNAPHLTHSMPFVIPCYHWRDVPFYWSGLKLYDALAGKLGLGRTVALSKKQVQSYLPTIDTDRLKGGVLYYDGQFDDANLAVAIARTAVAHGATIVNYMRCDALIKTDGKIAGLRVVDTELGDAVDIPARVVINATGVFVDGLRRQDNASSAELVRPSQGVHLVLDRKFFPGDTAMMIPKTADGRVLFAVPWLGHVVVGTTDTPVSETALEPRALEQEIDFILTHAAMYLTQDPKPEDVLSVFVGLRPLVNQSSAKRTAQLSRDHVIEISDSNLVTITGGKWTTYRHMAADVVSRAEQVAGLTRGECKTESLRLDDDPSAAMEALRASSPELAQPLHPRLSYCQADVVWAVRYAMARTLEDVLARRTRAMFLDARASLEAAPTVATIMARELGWTDAQTTQQLEAYREVANGYLLGPSPNPNR
ncbi:MAG: glycerol-3-phosphate dehydrogenase/oxidase [Planctomycetaceae bacterium]